MTQTTAEFDYPDGASESGVDNETLSRLHEETLLRAGSATKTLEFAFDSGGSTSADTYLWKFDDGDISSETRTGGPVEYGWAPTDEDDEYIRMESDVGVAYRIEDSFASESSISNLGRGGGYFLNTEWGPAETVVRTDGGPAVRYRSVGFGRSDYEVRAGVENYEATLLVSDDGYAREFSYDATIAQSGTTFEESVTVTATAVGETNLSAPAWLGQARSEGVKFDVSVTADDSVLPLELTNGTVPADATVHLYDDRGETQRKVPSALSPGDTLYVGFSADNGLLMSTDRPPADAREFAGRPLVGIRTEFDLLERNPSL